MSYALINLVNGKRCGGPYRRGLLLALAWYADDDGSSVFPSVTTLAELAEMHDRTVQRNLQAFMREGLLELVSTRPGQTSTYRLNVVALNALPALRQRSNRSVHRRAYARDAFTPGAVSPLTPGAASPVTPGAVLVASGTTPRVATVTTGDASPSPRQSATQPCQGTYSAAADEDEWISAILAVTGPGLADPEKHRHVKRDLALCVPAWRAQAWDLKLDILPVFKSATAKPRANGPLHKPSLLGDAIASRYEHRTAMSGTPNASTGPEMVEADSVTAPTPQQTLAKLKFDLARFQSGRPFREYRDKPPPPEGWERFIEQQIVELEQRPNEP